MTEWDVKQIIKKHEEENSEGCFGLICWLVCLACFFYTIHVAGKDYTALKEKVKTLEWRIEALEKK
jgi:hypothetical protein